MGIRVVNEVEREIDTIADRVLSLLNAGWKRIRIVTDHGWLLLPGGLPKVDLPASLVQTKWARCASVRGDSHANVPVYPWHWNSNVRIASPPGIGSFIAGTEYAHGGVSLQECVVPEIVIEPGTGASRAVIKSVSWRGMRCRVSVESNTTGLQIDLRTHYQQPQSSIVAAHKSVDSEGESSLAVGDDRHEGVAVTVVLLDAAGNVLDYKATTVGESA
jgi:hypothetical protein